MSVMTSSRKVNVSFRDVSVTSQPQFAQGLLVMCDVTVTRRNEMSESAMVSDLFEYNARLRKAGWDGFLYRDEVETLRYFDEDYDSDEIVGDPEIFVSELEERAKEEEAR